MPLHCSALKFVRGAYIQAAVPGITRSLYATDGTSLKKMSLKKFQAIWQPWAGVEFRLQNETLLQLCVGMYAGANKGRLKGYILHPPTVKID